FLQGGWLLVAPLAVAITRKAGSGILAELLAATMEFVFLGSPVGPVLFFSAFLQGLGSGLPFGIGGYMAFGVTRYAISGFLGAFFVCLSTAMRVGWFGQDVLGLRLIIHCSSYSSRGGMPARLLVRAIKKTGVVDHYAIVRAHC